MDESANAEAPEDKSEPPKGKKKEVTRTTKVASWTACGLWALSIILSFCIPPNSPAIWIPDAILLLGFYPLIWICPWSLVWIAWGILTTFIGWFLLLLSCLPDSGLPAQSLGVKHHLAEYHVCWPWLIMGALVTICGTIRLIINTVKLIQKKRNTTVQSS